MPRLPADRFEELVAAKRADAALPAVVAGIVADDGLAWFTAQGWTDLDAGTVPTDRSLARVASVTKTFTATAVLQLVDRGLVSLDDPLDRARASVPFSSRRGPNPQPHSTGRPSGRRTGGHAGD